MTSSNQDAVRAVRLAEHGGDADQPWRQLEAAVQEAVVRLRATHWAGGQEVLDADGAPIIIWEMPPLPAAGGSGRVAFDAEGRLLGYAQHIKRWYEWYRVQAPNSWMFFAKNVTEDETLFFKNWVERLAR